jgi:hypothetical protein
MSSLDGTRTPRGSANIVAAVHHRADQLHFLLLRGEVNLTPLCIFASRQIAWRGRRVDFFVLGASHAVCVETQGKVAVFEILSCRPVTGANHVLAAAQLTVPRTVSAVFDDLTYECELSPFPLDGWTDSFTTTYASEDQLRFAYDSAHQGSWAPLTCVAWRAGRDLVIETVHTYPQEGLGIRSRSHLVFPADGH